MIPDKKNPIWQELIKRPEAIPFSSLPTRMLMMRVKLMNRDGSPQKIQESVDIMFNYFSKNEQMLQEDIDLLVYLSKDKA